MHKHSRDEKSQTLYVKKEWNIHSISLLLRNTASLFLTIKYNEQLARFQLKKRNRRWTEFQSKSWTRISSPLTSHPEASFILEYNIMEDQALRVSLTIERASLWKSLVHSSCLADGSFSLAKDVVDFGPFFVLYEVQTQSYCLKVYTSEKRRRSRKITKSLCEQN